MKRRYLLAFVFPVVGLLAIGWASLHKITFPPMGQPSNDEPVGEIYGSIKVGQTFVAKYPGLYRIDVLLATYKRANTQDVTLHLRRGPEATSDLVSLTFNAKELEDNKFRSFTFPPIQDSAKKVFYFYFDSPESEPGDAITIWARSDDAYPEGSKFVNGAPARGDLAFMTYYQPGPLQTADALLDRIVEDKPLIWGSKGFYVVLALAYLALFVAFLFQVLRIPSEGR